MNSSRQPLNPQPKQDYKKVLSFFHHNIPANFLLSQNLLYGQCLITQASPTFQLLSRRKRCRYIANSQQIILMLLQQGSNQRLTRHFYIRILFQEVISIKLSVYYCGIILHYSEYNGEKDRKKYAIYIQAIDIGQNKSNQLRQFLVKWISSSSRYGVNNEKFTTYCEWTLLDYQIEGWDEDAENEERRENEENREIQEEEDKIVGKNKIRETRIVNLKKKKEEVAKWIEGDSKAEKKVEKVNKNILSKRYKIYSQISFAADKKQPQPYTFYLSQKPTSSQKKSTSAHLLTLKLIPLVTLSNNSLLLQKTLNECNLHKSYQLTTPYISALNKVFITEDNFVLEYKYFQGNTIRQLMKKQKIDYSSYQKSFMKEFIAQIVCAIGHIHECGIVVDGIGVDWVYISGDGLVGVVPGVANFVKIDNKSDLEQNDQVQRSVEKNMKNLAPEELMNPFKKPCFQSDWWSFGMLLYEMLNRYHYFDSCSQQKIKNELTNIKAQLDFSALQKKIQNAPELLTLIKNLLQKDISHRLGSKNDYHTVLDMPYFKGIDKNKLMKRQAQPLMKIKKIKIGKQIHLEEKGEKGEKKKNGKQIEMEMREIKGNVRKMLESVVFDRDMEFQ